MEKQQTNTRIDEMSDSFQLGVYLMAIRTKYPDSNGYEEEARLIEEEFGIAVTPRALFYMEEPTIEEEVLDKKLIYKNLGL